MLIHCALILEGGEFVDIPFETVGDRVGNGDGFVWVALVDATPEELDKAEAVFNLPSLAMEDVRHGNQRPKLEEYGETLFAVLRLFTPAMAKMDNYGQGEICVFAGHDYLVSMRRGTPSLLGVRARFDTEPELLRLGPGILLYALMDAVVDHYFPLIDDLESDLDNVEERIFTESAAYRENIETLYAIKRHITSIRHAVFPLMESAGRLCGGRTPHIAATCQEYFRDVHDHLARINAALDTLRETAATAIQVNLSLVAIEVSEVNKRLAAWAGIFAVATAFAGIWGMNFKFMPELDWPWGYPAALLLIGGICGFLYRRFRKTGWL
ncbi:MAG: magnesium and cobalt transport protein CorA [Zoogloeaceae bacterium]|jgi:magnesium transporter|nr:magnesium and cobalt transport protein CorA [Zoogloeaceae bacterium]